MVVNYKILLVLQYALTVQRTVSYIDKRKWNRM